MKSRGRRRHPDILTPRQWEVLDLVREGLTNDEIAARLGLSLAGVKFHISELFARLDVTSREDAAAWQPPPERRSWLLAPLGLLRRIEGFGAPARVAAGGVVALAAVGVALLAWGVFTTDGGASGAGAWRVEDAKTTHPSVMLFDLNAHVARRLPVDWDAPDARWFKAGETFLAGGDGASYGVYGLDGQRVESPMTQGNLTSDVVPVPDGSAVLVGRTDDQYIVSALPDGGGGTFLTGARHLAFAPDGLAIAWLAFGTYDKGGNVHPGRVIYVNHAVGRLIGFAGGGTAVEQDFNDQSLIDLAPNPWSPDGKYLLVERRAPCAPTVASCDNPPDFEVYAVPGASFDRVWSGYKGELSSAQWAGANRLLVTFSAGHVDPQFNTSQTFVPLFGGQPAPVPSIVRSSCCPVVSISPNGRYAIAYTGADNGQRCALFDMQTPPSTPNTNKAPGFTWTELASIRPAAGDFNTAFGFCSHAEWTPDGSMVIVSSSAAPTSAQR